MIDRRLLAAARGIGPAVGAAKGRDPTSTRDGRSLRAAPARIASAVLPPRTLPARTRFPSGSIPMPLASSSGQMPAAARLLPPPGVVWARGSVAEGSTMWAAPALASGSTSWAASGADVSALSMAFAAEPRADQAMTWATVTSRDAASALAPRVAASSGRIAVSQAAPPGVVYARGPVAAGSGTWHAEATK